jgi:hypothetical protein
MTIEKTHPLAGYRITDMVDGRYISKLYLGYTKQGAVSRFKRDINK